MRKLLKKTLIVILIVFIVINIFLGLIGISSLLLTVSMYLATGFLLIKFSRLLFRDPARRLNIKMLLVVLLSLLFVAEVFFRYGLKSNLTYSEQNGKFFYNSMYKRTIFDNFRRRYILKQQDPQLNTYPPNSRNQLTKPEFSYLHTYNSHGLRDHEWSSDTSLFTIVGLGDSFTEGYGSPQDSTWLRLLENKLRQQIPGLRVQTVNGGISNSDPFSEILLLEKQLLQYHPDMVIVALNNSDINDVTIRGGKERFSDGSVSYKSGPWWEFFYSFSYLFRTFIHSVCGYNYLLIPEKEAGTAQDQAVSLLRDCLVSDFKSLALKHHFKLVVVLQPMQEELEKNNFSLTRLSENLAGNKGITTINLFNDYRTAQSKQHFSFKSLYWATDLHHNSSGYRLWAEILAEKLRPQIEAQLSDNK